MEVTKGVRESVRKHGERIKNIVWDYAHKVGDEVAEIASEYNAVTILEKVGHLRETARRDSSFNKKLPLWFYRRVHFTISYETLERGLEVKHVNLSGRPPRAVAEYSTARSANSPRTETWLRA